MMRRFKIDSPEITAHHGDSLIDPIDLHYNKAVGAYAVPPFIIGDKKEVIRTADDLSKIAISKGDSRILHSVMPLWAKCSSAQSWWLLPIEPIVSVSCYNKITRREVAKSTDAGTIKERWTQDDWAISISGTLIGQEGRYPSDEVGNLISLFNAGEAIDVRSDFLQTIGISSIVIESIDLPPTKGLESQNYTISGYSDKLSQLLITE